MTSIVVLLSVLTCHSFLLSSSVHRSGHRSLPVLAGGWEQYLSKVTLVNALDQGVTPLESSFDGRAGFRLDGLGLSSEGCLAGTGGLALG